MIKIAAVSDIHGSWKRLQVPEEHRDTELLILAGDLFSSDSVPTQEKELPGFLRYIHELFDGPEEIIIVPGNHDYLFERKPYLNLSAKVLIDKEYEYISREGDIIRIYGNPRTNLMMAFPRLTGEEDIYSIPAGVDILVTHDSPRLGENGVGSLRLANHVINNVRPGIHIFGHHHHRFYKEYEGIKFYNVSCSLTWIEL